MVVPSGVVVVILTAPDGKSSAVTGPGAAGFLSGAY
jgi:hypothetical protein